MSDINYHKRGCLTCRSPDCPVWQAAVQNYCKSQADDDAEVAKKERERLYKLLESKCVEYKGVPVVHYNEIEDIFLRGEPCQPE